MMEINVSNTHKEVRIILSTLCLLAAALFILPFIPELQPLSLSLRAAGAVCIVGACGLAFIRNNHEKTNVIAGIAVGIVAFLVALALAFTQVPFASADEIQSHTTTNTNRESKNADVVEYTEPDFDKIASEHEKLLELKSIGKATLKNRALRTNYVSHSGADLLWDDAQAYLSGTKQILTVPLQSELHVINKVLFIWNNGTLITQELFGEITDIDTVHIRLWQGEDLSLNQIVEKSSVSSDDSDSINIQTRGMDWGSLNDCLSNLGISWAVLAVISVACGAACALTAGLGCLGCLSVATGFTGGSIASCVTHAWK